jgi:hypothetical protein
VNICFSVIILAAYLVFYQKNVQKPVGNPVTSERAKGKYSVLSIKKKMECLMKQRKAFP